MIKHNKLRLLLAALLMLVLNTGAQSPAVLIRSDPEAQGVSSESIISFLNAIKTSKQEWHSFMLMRHGKVVAEGWWNPYKPTLRHSMYSVSKSFTSTAVGFAVTEKKLSVSDKVITFFPGQLPDTVSSYLSQLTVKDLLIMASGHDPEPTSPIIASGKNWATSFLAMPLVYKPGTKFLYNTMATYMLSAIVQKVTGEKIMDYLRPRLFVPLGIQGIDWEQSREGINTGGFGLRLKTEDMARFGQLYLQNGSWQGKQLLPKDWVAEATTSKIDPLPIWVAPGTPRDSSDWMQGYGYQFWRCRNNTYRADGLAGQFIIVMPEQDAVLAITAEIYTTQNELNLVWNYLLPAFHKEPLPADNRSASLLRNRLSALAVLPLAKSAAMPAKSMEGKHFQIDQNEKNISNISFNFKGNQCIVILKTDSATYNMAYGSADWVNGETRKQGPYQPAVLETMLPYKVAGSYTWKDDQTLELVMRYIETPHTETMRCHFEGKTVSVEVSSSKSNSRKYSFNGRFTD